MNNIALKNNEEFLAQPFKTLMYNFISQHVYHTEKTDDIVNVEQCVACPDDVDENRQDRRKSSRNRRKNQDRRTSNKVNYNGHARRLTIDRREVFTDRRKITD